MINGQLLRDSIISAANKIYNLREEVNALNVFPVPDGDTGSNMSNTMKAAKTMLEGMSNDSSVTEVADVTASSLLRGARGNSGVILSLFFRGLAKAFSGKQEITTADFSAALLLATKTAYDAVSKPTEGTILTVIRETAEVSAELAQNHPDFPDFWNHVCKKAEEVLATTPLLLPILAESGVVDSGGKGLLVIFEGMQSVFDGKGIISREDAKKEEAVDGGTPANQEEITFYYCTEFLINLADSAATKQNINTLREHFNNLGDSTLIVDDGSIIKVHIHTNNPGLILEEGIKCGMLTDIKIDNLWEEAEEKKRKANAKKHTRQEVNEDIEYGFVAVASGNGLCDLFASLGVNNVVRGGQTMNPSTEELLIAIEATPSKTVFVLPNNKNVIMAAEQTVKLADRRVVVLPSRTIPQGIAAIFCFNETADLKTNQLAMKEAIERTKTGLITHAVRNSKVGGKEIKTGDIIAIENGKIKFAEKDCVQACMRLIKQLTKKQSSCLTLFYGEGVSAEEAANAEAQARKKYSNLEVNVIDGGQPVYHFIISIE
ncbi:MAG: DAK2 domain-containing protein [Oscillospiraceae bacterium]|jgi:DAK2 domain fusion protein YloV|nr:DAK2 domain-containing protein [Oscillospiraceae bacterium]